MKTILAVSILSLGAALTSIAEDGKQPLIVKAPAPWKVEFKDAKEMQNYRISREDGHRTLTCLSFLRSPDDPDNMSDIPGRLELIAKGFLAAARATKTRKLKNTNYKVERIDGDTFPVWFVQFKFEDGLSDISFFIGDEEGIWCGGFMQIGGTKDHWDEALSILKHLKKNG